MKPHKPLKGFTLIELLVVIGVLAVLAAAVILVLNPAELLKQSRDANRLSDMQTLQRSFALVEALGGVPLDLDGPNYTNACRNQSAPKIFVSVPSDNGEATSTPPAGWDFVRVPKASIRNIDGTGWIPVDLRSQTTKVDPPFSALPVDPVNTFASGLYYSYVCGSYEFNAALESKKLSERATFDGGDNDLVFESGSNLKITPPRTIPGQTAFSIASISPINGRQGTTVTSTIVSGTGFQSGASVRLTRNGSPDIAGSGFQFTSSSTLDSGQFNLGTAATGSWSVAVTNPDLAVSVLPSGFTVTDPAVPAPAVSSISPASANRGTTVSAVSVGGAGFLNGLTVKLKKIGQTDISGSGFTVSSATAISNVSFDIPGTVASGTWDVVVQNSDTQFDTLAGGFTINAPLPITMTASSFAVKASSTVLSWIHTVGAGNNRLLLVGISFWNGNSESVTVKLDGATPLSLVGSVNSTSGDKAQIWSLVNPTAGAHSIDISATGLVHIVAGATSWINADTAGTPLGTFVSAIGSDSNPTLNLSSAQGEVVQDVLAYFGLANPGLGQTLLWRSGTGQEYGVGSTKNGNSSVTMSWTITASSTWALGAVPIRQAP